MDQDRIIDVADIHLHLNGLEVEIIDYLVKSGLYKDRGQVISMALRAYDPFKRIWEKRWEEEYQKLLVEVKGGKEG